MSAPKVIAPNLRLQALSPSAAYGSLDSNATLNGALRHWRVTDST
jgi:hypothetical protein